VSSHFSPPLKCHSSPLLSTDLSPHDNPAQRCCIIIPISVVAAIILSMWKIWFWRTQVIVCIIALAATNALTFIPNIILGHRLWFCYHRQVIGCHPSNHHCQVSLPMNVSRRDILLPLVLLAITIFWCVDEFGSSTLSSVHLHEGERRPCRRGEVSAWGTSCGRGCLMGFDMRFDVGQQFVTDGTFHTHISSTRLQIGCRNMCGLDRNY